MPVADEQLMLHYAAGDAVAFDALYARPKGPLYRFVRRSVRDAAQADELYQDVWTLVDHWRLKGLVAVSLDEEREVPLELDAGPAADPARVAEGREALARLAAALAALPLAQREAFLLHEEGGLGAAEIAAASGVTMEAGKSRLRYAMNKLRHYRIPDAMWQRVRPR